MRLLELLEKHDIHVKEFCDLVPKHSPLDDVYLMKGDAIVARLNIASVSNWVFALDESVNLIESMLKAERVELQDKDSALKCISETCMPKRLSDIYLKFVFKGGE